MYKPDYYSKCYTLDVETIQIINDTATAQAISASAALRVLLRQAIAAAKQKEQTAV